MSDTGFQPTIAVSAFQPLPFAVSPSGWTAVLATPATIPEKEDDVADAYARGRAEAEGECASLYEARLAEREAEWSRRTNLLSALEEGWRDTLEHRLRDTVLALCSAVLEEAAYDPAALAKRCETAARMLEPAMLGCTAMLHPDDAELLRSIIGPELALHGDPKMARGSFRIETAEGGIEDGPAPWRSRLEEALASC